MKALLFIIASPFIMLIGFITSRNYPIVEQTDNYIVIERKGQRVVFHNTTPGYNNKGTVRILFDRIQ